ncbi:MAG: hypothetical protein R3Y28_02375 [Candidatus Gastranaerophilales bacterium]
MVDNRSAGFFGVGGSFNFKSGDISGTAAKTQDDKMGQGSEYFLMRKNEDNEEANDASKFTDRSAVLRATLNSLAMMNVADVINAKKKAIDEQYSDNQNIENVEKIKNSDEENSNSQEENNNENSDDDNFEEDEFSVTENKEIENKSTFKLDA